MKKIPALFLVMGFHLFACGQKMAFEKYDPVSTLVVPEHPLKKSKYPFIDVHNHQWEWITRTFQACQNIMDALNMLLWLTLVEDLVRK
jgi:hypothetical protein